MKAILVDVDFATGWRAGGIDPRGLKHPTSPQWQDTENGREIRLIGDGDVAEFDDVEGVIILDGEVAIDAAVTEIEAAQPEQHIIWDASLLVAHIAQRHINLDDFAEMSQQETQKALHELGLVGISKVERNKAPRAAEMKRHWTDHKPPIRGKGQSNA